LRDWEKKEHRERGEIDLKKNKSKEWKRRKRRGVYREVVSI